jgi:YajR YAM domain
LALALGAQSVVVVIAALVIFFSAFNTMEALLPSLVTKAAPAGAKGTATGIYSSSQFLGIFFGGAVGGWASAVGGVGAVFGFALAVALFWLALAVTMKRPQRYKSYLARLDGALDGDLGTLAARLQAAPGVIEAAVAPDEGVAYLKIDASRFDAAAIARITGGKGQKEAERVPG